MKTVTQGIDGRARRTVAAFVMLLLALATTVALAGETITFFVNDNVGSPIVATDVNGLQAWREAYRPYGDRLLQQTYSQKNQLWFTAKPADGATGLIYMGARYYDPTL